MRYSGVVPHVAVLGLLNLASFLWISTGGASMSLPVLLGRMAGAALITCVGYGTLLCCVANLPIRSLRPSTDSQFVLVWLLSPLGFCVLLLIADSCRGFPSSPYEYLAASVYSSLVNLLSIPITVTAAGLRQREGRQPHRSVQ